MGSGSPLLSAGSACLRRLAEEPTAANTSKRRIRDKRREAHRVRRWGLRVRNSGVSERRREKNKKKPQTPDPRESSAELEPAVLDRPLPFLFGPGGGLRRVRF